jgi:acetate kinase
MNVLVINAGSSSLKYQLFDMKTETILAKGLCDRIGIDGHLKHTPAVGGKPVFDSAVNLPTHAEAISAVIDKLTGKDHGVIASLSEIGAVGHRIVHGGAKFSESVLIDDDVLKAIDDNRLLAPLHTPANLMGIHACSEVMPGKPQVAVFDTAFHHTIPDYAYIYPIPYKYYENNHLRRYGFHGTSHRYVLAETLKILGGSAKGTRIITCHLGNGSSLAAIKDGKCIDTTMGVTPLEGVPMGTRSGSIDPTLIELIAEIDNLTLEQTMHILNKESGVLGISGVSSDFRDLQNEAGIDIGSGHKAHTEGSRRAELALEIFNYQVAKFIGAYIAVMGGLDALVFTAGVGENSAHTRKGICSILNGIGICIDEKKNVIKSLSGYEDITGEGSIADVYVIPTNEELVIARDTRAIVGD